jgi:SulP family sulfate permease
MLIGGCVGGAWIALTTSLPPLATSIDSPTGTVLILLSSMVAASVRAAGGDTGAAIQSIMLVFTAATLLSGVSLYALGAWRCGSYFRFIPYSVVAGFLAATGYFLIVGAVRMATGRYASMFTALPEWTAEDVAKIVSAVLVLVLLLGLHRWMKWALALPAGLIAMWLVSVIALHALGLFRAEDGWYLHSVGTLIVWSPLAAVGTSHLTWPMLLQLLPELLAVTIVNLVSLVTKVSSMEVARQTSGDLDRELRGHGIGSLIAAPLGGLISSFLVSSSRLLVYAGGATRMSGVACALVFGLVGVMNLDLPGLIPVPIIAGLVLYLGYGFVVDALWRPYLQRAWLDLALAIGIMVVCINYGYLVGVMAGIICSCLSFVISYARLGVVRRHLTRAQFSSRVDRSLEASEHLRSVGDAMQIYWLSGYIFFGSSEGLFERIRGDIEKATPHRVMYVILDLAMVSGSDSSAMVSLAKLRSYCNQRDITIVYCSVSPNVHDLLARGDFIGRNIRHRAFGDIHAALAWCEDRLLADAGIKTDSDFLSWLQRQLGPTAKSTDLVAYLDRGEFPGATVVHRQAEAADTIDLVAAGQLVVDVATPTGQSLRVRRIATYTAVGEMGFFRRSMRSATVSSEGPTVLFTMTRANFERMRRERPDLAFAFEDFMIRVLSERLETRDREVAALESLAG